MAEDLSLVRGAVTPPLLEHTIGAALDLAVQRSPDAEALVSIHQGVRWTWAELGRRADALAAGLLALGLRPGDRVGVWGPNSAQWALAQFATARAGLIQVNINPAYRLSEVEYTLNKVGVKALIAAERFKTSDYAGMIETLAPEISGSAPGALSSARLPDLRSLIKIGGEARPGWPAPSRSSSWRRSRAIWTAISRSISSSPAAPLACPRARRCRTGTS